MLVHGEGRGAPRRSMLRNLQYSTNSNACILIFIYRALSTLFYYYKMKKRQLWDQGFRRNSSLQAAWDISIARTTYGYYLTPSRMLVVIEGDKKSDSCGTPWVYKCVTVSMCATLVTFVGPRNLINSMRGKKWSGTTRWIGQTITRNGTQNMSGEWRE